MIKVARTCKIYTYVVVLEQLHLFSFFFNFEMIFLNGFLGVLNHFLSLITWCSKSQLHICI